MKFELNEYKKQLTDDEILCDIKRVADELNVDYLSIRLYRQHGKCSQTAIQAHFGTWKYACSLVGLRTERYPSELKLVSDEDYYNDLRRVAELIESDTVLYDAYIKYGKYSSGQIFARFKKWDIALRNAGLQGTGFSKDKITEQQCFDEIERIWIMLGRQPTSTDIKNGVSVYSIDTFKRRFGGWRSALEAFVKYVNTDNTEVSNDPTNEDKDINSPNEIKHHNIDTKTIREPNASNSPNTASFDETSLFRHKTKREPSNRLKVQVLMRDGNRCRICGVACNDGIHKIHFDHIIPWSKGGETTLENLQVLCSDCNEAFGNLDK